MNSDFGVTMVAPLRAPGVAHEPVLLVLMIGISAVAHYIDGMVETCLLAIFVEVKHSALILEKVSAIGVYTDGDRALGHGFLHFLGRLSLHAHIGS